MTVKSWLCCGWVGVCDIVHNVIFDVFALGTIGWISPLDMALNFFKLVLLFSKQRVFLSISMDFFI